MKPWLEKFPPSENNDSVLPVKSEAARGLVSAWLGESDGKHKLFQGSVLSWLGMWALILGNGEMGTRGSSLLSASSFLICKIETWAGQCEASVR